MSGDADIDLAAFLDEFKAEAGEHLQALDAQLLVLERDPTDPAPVRAMFLSAHTIKGCAALLDLAPITTLAHALEDVLALLRDQKQPLDAPTADLLFRALDALRDLVERASLAGQPNSQPAAELEELVEALRSRAAGQASMAAAAAIAPAPAPAGAAPASAGRVLLIEDSATVRLLATMLLTDAGFRVDAVGDGQAALALALSTPYQLLVTGIETRGVRGLDLAAMLRQVPAGRALPIIVMSSDDNAAHRQRAADLGVQAYIRKGSFGRQRLVEVARELTAAP